MMLIKQVYKKILFYGILLSFTSPYLLYCNPIDFYGYRSKNEIIKHRKLEGSNVDKKYEIYSKSVKTKVSKILNNKGNNGHSSVTVNINRTKSGVNSILSHKYSLLHNKSIQKQRELTKYDLKKLKSVINKTRIIDLSKVSANSKKTNKKNNKVVLQKKSKAYNKKKRVKKLRTVKKIYHR